MHSVSTVVLFGLARLGLIAAWATAAGFTSPARASAEEHAVPQGIDIQAAIQEHFAKIKGHKSGDFLTHNGADAAIASMERRTGWTLEAADRKALLKLTIDDKSFFAQQLTSKLGKEFARQIAPLPLGYDKLDRLSQLPQGRSTLERLVIGPDGYKLLEYMTTSNGGQDLSRMLSVDGQGNFEKPTGKIYDDVQLAHALTQLHKQVLSRKAAKGRGTTRYPTTHSGGR